MKSLPVLLWVLLATALPLYAETVYVLEITDYDGSEELMAVTSEKARTIESSIRNESRFYNAALRNAASVWSADETHKDDRFPVSAIGRRSVRRLKIARSMEEASELIDRYDERASRAQDRKADRDREKEQRELRSLRGDDRKDAQDRLARDRAKGDSKEALDAAAVELFKTELDKLMDPAANRGAEAKDAPQEGGNAGDGGH